MIELERQKEFDFDIHKTQESKKDGDSYEKDDSNGLCDCICFLVGRM